MGFFTVLILVGLTLSHVDCTCPATPNQKLMIMDPPVSLAKTDNGQKLLIGDLDDPQGNYLYIAKLKGTPYEMGKAFGQLFREELIANTNGFYSYYLDQLQKLLEDQHVPKFLAQGTTKSVKRLGLTLLDFNIQITKRYTNPRYYQEIAGIAAGAKINGKDIARMNIVPETIKAACTVAGVWGAASFNNHTLHVRSLDWDAGNPISKFPIIVVYHPSDPNLIVHANIGWIGFVGVLTGMSPKITLGEKVWLPRDGPVKTTRYGNPWTYVLRDLLYEAHNIKESLKILTEAHRTCAIHIGLGSSQDQSFRMLEYSERILVNYNDKNYTHYNESSHPQRAGIAYFDKHPQPSNDDCVGSLLKNTAIYGKWEMESLWRILGNSHQTGDTQHVVFDLTDQKMILSYSRTYLNPDNQTVVEKAFARNPIYIDMHSLWTPI